VVYAASALTGHESALTAHELAIGGTLLHSFTFSHIGQVVHVLSVPASQMSSAETSLRSQAGVVSVAPTGARRFTTSVTTPYFPNDPYFSGFTQAQNATANNPSTASPAPATNSSPPYYESNLVPGQWDMHAIQLEYAFGYSQANNGSNFINSNALGLSSVNLAIIDTGEDPNHPELAGKITRQRCYITDPSNKQSTSNFETDPLGHGTNVTGIAAADTNNALGFSSAGGKTSIFAYRVFPTPDDNCVNENTTDQQCGADTSDIAAAINDAVTGGASIISMSLGGATCGTGSGFAPNGDSDVVEGAAVADAIAANVIVVAASGNSGTGNVAAPGCDAGVIAVGATGLADGNTNGSNVPGGTVAAIRHDQHVRQFRIVGDRGARRRSDRQRHQQHRRRQSALDREHLDLDAVQSELGRYELRGRVRSGLSERCGDERVRERLPHADRRNVDGDAARGRRCRARAGGLRVDLQDAGCHEDAVVPDGRQSHDSIAPRLRPAQRVPRAGHGARRQQPTADSRPLTFPGPRPIL
jgi:hypothetical protein